MKFLNKNKGFTLIELLVVVAIIGLLASVVLASLSTARGRGRDAKRLQDMNQVRTALELYNSTNNAYPSTGGAWWGVCPAFQSKGTSGFGGYIPDLAPTYIPILPTEPKPTANNTCYVYRSDGRDYIFLVYLTVEGNIPNSLKRPGIWSAEKDYAIYTSASVVAGW